MKDFLHHLLFPRESNNHRPKILHHKSLLFLIALLFAGQIFISFAKNNYPQILGANTNIAIEELLKLTNEKRQENGVKALNFNDRLAQAARLKAKDMLEKDYWAHNAPDGTTPWFFVKNSGYDYVYAGENLARGFSSSKDIVEAWMESSSHRENMLSNNYKDIGFAIMEGKLNGEEGVLVVEMFGSRDSGFIAKSSPEEIQPIQADQKMPEKPILEKQPLVASVRAKPFIDVNSFSKPLLIFILSFFILIFILDMIIIERKKIVRLVGHNLDHILFLTGILILVLLFSKGAAL